MSQKKTVTLIELAWSGPYTTQEVLEFTSPEHLGILQVYGTHPVFGDDALLCLDVARRDTFASRIGRIMGWLRFLPSEPTFYLGRPGGTEPVDATALDGLIDTAAKLNVYFHAPPWNGAGVNAHDVTEPTVVLNMGHRHRLQLEVSNLWDHSRWEPGSTDWKPYEPGASE